MKISKHQRKKQTKELSSLLMEIAEVRIESEEPCLIQRENFIIYKEIGLYLLPSAKRNKGCPFYIAKSSSFNEEGNMILQGVDSSIEKAAEYLEGIGINPNKLRKRKDHILKEYS